MRKQKGYFHATSDQSIRKKKRLLQGTNNYEESFVFDNFVIVLFFLYFYFLVCPLFKKQTVSSLAENWSFRNEIFLYESTMLSCHNLVIGLFVFVGCQFCQL
jgi:hypothetical protein